MLRFCFLLVTVLIPVVPVSAGRLEAGLLQLEYDSGGSRCVLRHPSGTVELLPPEIVSGDRRRLVPAFGAVVVRGRVLERSGTAGGLALVERLTLSESGIDRELEITNPGPADGGMPPKMRAAIFPWSIPASGSYWFLASERGNGSVLDPGFRGRLEMLEAGRRVTHPNYSVNPLLIGPDGRHSWLFCCDARSDRTATGIHASGGGPLRIDQEFASAGWLELGEPQRVNGVSLRIADRVPEEAFRTEVRRWFEEKAVRPVADRPEWLCRALIYSGHPGGSILSGMRDVGGFDAMRSEVVPIVRALGFNTFYLLPLEDGGIYQPRDYRKLAWNTGTPEEYRKFVAAAHSEQYRVLQDLVPHGNSPAAGRWRGDSPAELIYREDGTPPDYWSFDYGSRSWRRKIGAVAEFYLDTFGIDGFRLDGCEGNPDVNWRRRGFPAECPPNVDAEWFRCRIGESGMPGLDYPRAGMSQRGCVLELVDFLRRTIRSRRADAVAFAEAANPLNVAVADLIYDSWLAVQLPHKFWESDDGDGLAEGLRARMEEQYFSDPAGLLRMRCLDNHDTVVWRGLLGLGLWKALHTVVFTVPGVPMVLQGREELQSVRISELAELRRKFPELSGTLASFERLTPDRNIFNVIRELPDGGGALAVFCNLSSTARPCPWKVPPRLRSMRLSRELFTGVPAENLVLPPFGSAFFALRPASAPMPELSRRVRAPLPPAAAAGGEPLFRNEADRVAAETPAYCAELSLRTGRLLSFFAPDGTLLCDGSAWSRDFLTGMELTAVDCRWEAPVLHCSAGELKWNWRVLADRLTLEISGAGELREPLSLVFSGCGVRRYQAACAEGGVDDWFFTRHARQRNRLENNLNIQPGYRRPGTNTVWRGTLVPPALRDARIAAWNGAGTLELNFPDPVRYGAADLRMLDHFGGRDDWACAVVLFEPPEAEFSHALPSRRSAGAVRLELRSGGRLPGVQSEAGDSWSDGRFRLSHRSTDWQVEGPFGTIILRRAGGGIREWRSPGGSPLIRDCRWGTDRGFGRQSQPVYRPSFAELDTETECLVRSRDGSLLLRFAGMLRSYSLWRANAAPIWFVRDYEFRPDGSVRQCAELLTDGAPLADEWRLFLRCTLPGANRSEWKDEYLTVSGLDARLCAEFRRNEPDRRFHAEEPGGRVVIGWRGDSVTECPAGGRYVMESVWRIESKR